MNQTESPVKILLGAFLLSAATNGLATSFGPVRGAAIVGSPFNVTLTTQVDPSAGLSALCIAADVFFGDSQIPPDRVRISIEKGASVNQALVRIRTNSAVNEPVVTVIARGGCTQSIIRKYVLLAEIQPDRFTQVPTVVGEVITSTQESTQPSAANNGSRRTILALPAAVDSGLNSKQPLERSSEPVARPVRPVARPAVRVSPAPAPAPAAAANSKSSSARLKLDLLDITAERDPVLRSSLELLTMPTSDVQQRVAAAALWQSLNAQPQDVLRENQRLKVLEADAALMLAKNQKHDEVTLELRTQLEEARGARYNNPLVYALGGLLTIILLGMIFLLLRIRRKTADLSDGPWWNKDSDTDDKLDMPVAASLSDDDAVGQNLHGIERSGSSELSSSGLDLYLGESIARDSSSPETNSGVPKLNVLDAKDRSNFSSRLTGMPRIVNAEELFDVQQHADFFVSLGDLDKAVEVLRGHIADNVDTSAVAYLDLFDLYHGLSRKEEYEVLREDFNRRFNAQVPAFDEYKANTHGLEFYTAAISRIELLWPTPKVLHVIEESIFRKPDSGSQAFSLAAYRELLLLHAIAKKIIERPGDFENAELKGAFSLPDLKNGSTFLPGAEQFVVTDVQPLPIEQENALAKDFFPEKKFDLTQPHSSPRLGLDIDLSVGFEDISESETLPGVGPRGSKAMAPDKNLIEFHLDSLPSPLSKDKPAS